MPNQVNMPRAFKLGYQVDDLVAVCVEFKIFFSLACPIRHQLLVIFNFFLNVYLDLHRQILYFLLGFRVTSSGGVNLSFFMYIIIRSAEPVPRAKTLCL